MPDQRARIITGAARALAVHGCAGLSVEHIIREAGVTRTAFYERFESKRDCVVVAHDEAFDLLAGTIYRACAESQDWPGKVSAAVMAAIDFATESPHVARLLVLDAVAADPILAARVASSKEHLIGLLRAGREHSTEVVALPASIERALIGAATSVIGNRLMAEEADRLAEMAPGLIEFMLVPYIGPDDAKSAALRATRGPVRRRWGSAARASESPLALA